MLSIAVGVLLGLLAFSALRSIAPHLGTALQHLISPKRPRPLRASHYAGWELFWRTAGVVACVFGPFLVLILIAPLFA